MTTKSRLICCDPLFFAGASIYNIEKNRLKCGERSFRYMKRKRIAGCGSVQWGSRFSYCNNDSQSGAESAAQAAHMIGCRNYSRSNGGFPHFCCTFPHPLVTSLRHVQNFQTKNGAGRSILLLEQSARVQVAPGARVLLATKHSFDSLKPQYQPLQALTKA